MICSKQTTVSRKIEYLETDLTTLTNTEFVIYG